MTTEFVPFQAELDIPDTFSGPATLVAEKDNPSGLTEHAGAVQIPITVAPRPPGSATGATPFAE